MPGLDPNSERIRIAQVGNLWSATLFYLTVGVLLVLVVVLVGEGVERHLSAIEAWIDSLGLWGVMAFVGLFVVYTTLLLPGSVLSFAAGALFGMLWGVLAVAAGSFLAAALQFALSQRLLKRPIERRLAEKPSLALIQRSVLGNELRLQFLLRLTPLNPATVSYVLGAAGVRFRGFMLACLALIPHLIVEVWFGYAGKHVVRLAGGAGESSTVELLLIIGGFLVLAGVMILIARAARKAFLHAATAAAGAADPAASG